LFRVQAELAETYDASQPAISRAITGVIARLAKVLKKAAFTTTISAVIALLSTRSAE
jgi:hypothetical protein